MTTTFTYTTDEREHLEGCLRYIFETTILREQYDDASYYRWMADELRADPTMHCNHDYPDPDDCFAPTAEDMDEEADKIECGFVGGEELI